MTNEKYPKIIKYYIKLVIAKNKNVVYSVIIDYLGVIMKKHWTVSYRGFCIDCYEDDGVKTFHVGTAGFYRLDIACRHVDYIIDID